MNDLLVNDLLVDFDPDQPTLDELQKRPQVQDAVRVLLAKVPLPLRLAHYERGAVVFDEFKPFRVMLDHEIELTEPEWIATLAGMDQAHTVASAKR